MELSDLIKPAQGKKRTQLKNKLINTLNSALKEAISVESTTNLTYGKFQPYVYAVGIAINNKNTIYKLKNLVEKIGLAQLPHEDQYCNFVTKALKQDKLYLECVHNKVNEDYAIDKNSIQLRLDDPRLFNPKKQTGLKIKIQFKIVPISVKAKKHEKALEDSSYGKTGYTPYRG